MRGWFRLFGFGAVTAKHAALLAARTGGRTDVAVGQSQARAWARELLDMLGVELVGDTPVGLTGALYVANHRSYIDIAALLAYAPVTYLAKAEIARWPLLGWAAATAGTMFVQRGERSSRQAARLALAQQLARGRSVAVFPEGTTTAGPGIATLRPGSFEVAAGRFPVVPVAIHYEHVEDAWTGDDGFLSHFVRRFQVRQRRVTLRMGPPLFDSDPHALRDRAAAWIRQELAALEGGPNTSLEVRDHEEAIQDSRAA